LKLPRRDLLLSAQTFRQVQQLSTGRNLISAALLAWRALIICKHFDYFS